MERSVGGAIDALTLERRGCPFEVVDSCAGRCLDHDDHLEEELPSLCVGDASYRERHPLAEPVQDAGVEEGAVDPLEASFGDAGLRRDGVEGPHSRATAEARP